MKTKNLILTVILSQLSVACLATPYVPTKSPPVQKGVAPPKSSPTDDVKSVSCIHQFKKEQSLEEVSNLAAQMQQDCDLTDQQVLALAQQEFELK